MGREKMFAACADGVIDMKRLAYVFSSSACFFFQNFKVFITIDPLFLLSEYYDDSFSLVAYLSRTTLLLSTQEMLQHYRRTRSRSTM